MNALPHLEPAVLPSRWLRCATIVTGLLAFPLVWLGGLVTTHGAGMSVPDWPNSYGYNMFALPFGMWLGRYAGGAFYEHTHRLLGTLVGLSSLTAALIAWGPACGDRARRVLRGAATTAFGLFIVLLGVAWSLRAGSLIDEAQYKPFTHAFAGALSIAIIAGIAACCRERDPLPRRRWAVTIVLIGVTIQGVIGGTRVTEISLMLARVHGIFGQLVFAGAVVVAGMCTRWWMLATPTLPRERVRRFRALGIAALLLVCTQLMLGALMRHDPRREAGVGGDGGAGMSIPDWPLHYGHLVPPIDSTQLAQANEFRRWTLHWPTTTLGAIWLHAAHRIGAYGTLIVLITLALYAWRVVREEPKLLWLATSLGLLVIAQVTLGVLTVLWRKPADVATLHQATGALLVMTAAVLVARVHRLYPLAVREVRRGEPIVADANESPSAQPA